MLTWWGVSWWSPRRERALRSDGGEGAQWVKDGVSVTLWFHDRSPAPPSSTLFQESYMLLGVTMGLPASA